MNSYAVAHPRLGVVAVVTAESSLDVMILLMKRDQSWGDLGVDEVVWIHKEKSSRETYSLFGAEDCDGHGATIQEVIAEIKSRRYNRAPGWLNGARNLLRSALRKRN